MCGRVSEKAIVANDWKGDYEWKGDEKSDKEHQDNKKRKVIQG